MPFDVGFTGRMHIPILNGMGDTKAKSGVESSSSGGNIPAAYPSLLRGFHNPASPIELRQWDGSPRGPGVYFDPVPPSSPSFLSIPPREEGPGIIRLPFDPERTLASLVYERGMDRARPLYTWLPFESRRLPSILRDAILRFSVRRRLRNRDAFPRWPAEPVVEGIRALVMDAARRVSPAFQPAPFWPDGKKYAAALTHDVDSDEAWKKGYWREFADIEEAHGLRSSWHVCSIHMLRWERDLEELARRGHEIAWHGPRHDYRIAFMTPAELAATLADGKPLMDRFGIRGFRSPNYLRTTRLYEGLAGTLGYDSSTMDTAAEPLSPTARTGCCTVFPFFRGDLLVIPLTLPDALTIRCLTGDDAGAISAVQLAKLEWIKGVGGLVFAITHPEAWISMRKGSFGAYRKLVERLAADNEAWKALPRSIEEWWRARFAKEAA